MNDACATCKEPLGWYEREYNDMAIADGWSFDCYECEREATMRAAIDRGEDELKAVAEVEDRQRFERRCVDRRYAY